MSPAALLVIGNEILSGKVRDTNSAFLAVELRKLGVDLERIVTIPDEVELIAKETRAMSEAYDFVFTSGGIGPTHDDMTMDGIALAFDRPIELNQAMVDRMQRYSDKPLNDAMKKMALIPGGAEIIDVGGLWFPVVIVENVHIFPGIPELFEKKFHSIRDRFSGVPFVLRKLYVRESESDIAEILNALLAEAGAGTGIREPAEGLTGIDFNVGSGDDSGGGKPLKVLFGADWGVTSEAAAAWIGWMAWTLWQSSARGEGKARARPFTRKGTALYSNPSMG